MRCNNNNAYTQLGGEKENEEEIRMYDVTREKEKKANAKDKERERRKERAREPRTESAVYGRQSSKEVCACG